MCRNTNSYKEHQRSQPKHPAADRTARCHTIHFEKDYMRLVKMDLAGRCPRITTFSTCHHQIHHT